MINQRTRNIREVQIRYRKADVDLPKGTRFGNSSELYLAFRDDMMSFPVEVFRVIFLNSKNEMISFEDIARGSISGAVVHPREAFWSAIHFRSAAVLFLHNHPSGDPAPSREDRECTERLLHAGSVLGIRVLDHIVVGTEEYFSFADAGMMNPPASFNATQISEKKENAMKMKKQNGKSDRKKQARTPGPKPQPAAETKNGKAKTSEKKVTIKQVVIGQILGNPSVTNSEMIAAVKARFPESAFSETHAAWYRSQARKGTLTGTKLDVPAVVRKNKS
jgi:proteasome lid subunit RPN8/RPN11